MLPDWWNKRADVWKVSHIHVWLSSHSNEASALTVTSNYGTSELQILQLNDGTYSQKDWHTLMSTQELMCSQRTSRFLPFFSFPSLSGSSGLRRRPRFGELRQYQSIPSLTYTRGSTRTVTLSYSLQPNPPVCPAFRSRPVSKPLPGQSLPHSTQLNRRSPSIRMRCFTAWGWQMEPSSSWAANLASDQMEPMVSQAPLRMALAHQRGAPISTI